MFQDVIEKVDELEQEFRDKIDKALKPAVKRLSRLRIDNVILLHPSYGLDRVRIDYVESDGDDLTISLSNGELVILNKRLHLLEPYDPVHMSEMLDFISCITKIVTNNE